MQQYFAERPQNTSVREGQMAVLRCRVGNQQGRVQWTKDGFALGKSLFRPCSSSRLRPLFNNGPGN